MEKTRRIFSKLTDGRQTHKVRYDLIDIVILTIVGVMCGCTDWTEIAMLCEIRIDYLRDYLELPNGVPSHDTFNRVMSLIDPQQLALCYQEWVSTILPDRNMDVISIDGKTVKGSGGKGFKPLHLVSAWSSAAGLTLGQVKTEEKSNEITAIPKLLKTLNLVGCIVTIDALGCQTKIADAIIKQQGNYVLAVKENQESLHNEIRDYFEEAEKSNYLDLQSYRAETTERNRGREEHRSLVQIGDCKHLSRFHDFAGARSIIRMHRITNRDGKRTEEVHYYISSLEGSDKSASELLRAIRAHWGIESCHWLLDVTFMEDTCRTRDLIAAENLSVARKIALALAKRIPDDIVEKYSHNKAKWTSLKKRLYAASLYPEYMMQILLIGM